MTNNDHYQKELFLAQVDKEDNVIQQIERWEAHEKGILHRGFTAILKYKDKIILQHRKHKAFDGYWDLSFSSHQIYKNDLLQSDEEAIYESLEREWYLKKEDVEYIVSKGKIYYKAKDPKSIYTEHEVDYIYLVSIKIIPKANLDYAYDYQMTESDKIKDILSNYNIAPWVRKMELP